MNETILPTGWPRPLGYSNGVIASGRIIAVAGQVGWNPLTATFETDDFVQQTRKALLNVRAVLEAVGSGPAHVVRMTWYITDRGAYVAHLEEIGKAWRDVFGKRYPAMTLVIVQGLLEPRALVEIEATAVVPE